MDHRNKDTFDMPKELRRLSEQLGIDVSSWSDDWVMEFRKYGKTHRLIGHRFDVNSVVSSMIAQDKVATHSLLASADVSSIPHVLYRNSDEGISDIVETWERIVLKPLAGWGGRSIHLCDDFTDSLKIMNESNISEWALSPYVNLQEEVRIVLVDGELLLSYAKQPIELGGMKMFNLRLGATPVPVMPNESMYELARSAASALQLRLAVVDIVCDSEDDWRVLEVNDSLSVEKYAMFGEANLEHARLMYRNLLSRLFT